MGKLYSIIFEFGCKIQSKDQHDDNPDSLDVSFEEQKNMKNKATQTGFYGLHI
jgi:hypothetical protein